MLKTIRELAVENPLILKIIMGVIALSFVITMGWWGIKAPKPNVVAVVNGRHEIKVTEYRRAYNNTIDYYRDLYKEKFDPEMIEKLKIRDRVLEDLVARELWLEKAEELGLQVSDNELRESIMKMNVFHNKEGVFDRNRYEMILTSNRITTKDFEQAKRQELLIEKMKRLVRDSVYVSDEEVKKTYPAINSKKGGKELSKEESNRLKKFLRFQKQEKAVRAYAEIMRRHASIKVNRDLL